MAASRAVAVLPSSVIASPESDDAAAVVAAAAEAAATGATTSLTTVGAGVASFPASVESIAGVAAVGADKACSDMAVTIPHIKTAKVRISSWTGSSDGPARMGDVAVSHTPTSSVRNEQSLLRVISFCQTVWCEDVSIQARAVNERKIDLPHVRASEAASMRVGYNRRWLAINASVFY